MNILMLSWRCPKHPNAGGAEQATLEHTKAWVKKGNKVTWFSASFVGAKEREIIEGVQIIRSGKQYFDVQVRACLWYLFGKHEKISFVVDQFHGIPFFTPLYVRVKKLAYIHEVAKEVWKLNPWPKPFNLIPSIIGSTFEPLVFQLYKNVHFMTVSDSTKKDLVSWGISINKIHVIHNGVNRGRKKKLPKKEKIPTFMYLGAIAEDKGIEDAFKVFAEISKKEDNCRFWVAGKASPYYEEQLFKWAKEYGIDEKFKYWGFVTEDKKFELLARAHVLINPSAREGWGLVNIEANLMGTPVVGYKVAGVEDSVRNHETGILLEANSYKLLASSAYDLLADKMGYKRFQRNSLKWSKKFDWDVSTDKSLNLMYKIYEGNI